MKQARKKKTAAAKKKGPRVRETAAERKKRARSVLERLRRVYPGARCELTHGDPFQLLVATILSAQCTDERVNKVTPALFAKYPDVRALAAADTAGLEELIRSTGFFRSKAKNIREAARAVVEKHGGEVPRRLEDLVKLPGVGRKTANVILGNAFGIPGIPVDTHMIRLNRLLGLTREEDPVRIEFDLMPLIPEKDWTLYSHLIIFHGRRRCFARRPDCAACEIGGLCPSFRK